MLLNRRHAKLSISVAGDTPPTEFRLFVSGWNDTEHGKFLFDEKAAKAVMAAAQAHGVDRMIDLEHLSLDTEARNFDPDARGWCKLEVREDGSLWAVNVTWTPDGITRLTEKRQRYISPAFETDPETKRVTKIFNIALTALPATHQTPELVAARAARDLRKLAVEPSFDSVRMAIHAALHARFPADDSADCGMLGLWVVDVYDTKAIYELDGKLFEVAYTFAAGVATLGATATEVIRTYAPIETTAAPAAAPAATTSARTAVKLAAHGENGMTLEEFAKVCKALGLDASMTIDEAMAKIKGEAPAEAPAEEPAPEADPAAAAAEPPAAPAAEDEDEKKAMTAATARLVKLSGKSTLGAALDEVEVWRASHIALEAEQLKVAEDRKVLELAQRKENAVKLTQLGAETPHTTGLAKGKLCSRLVNEPLDEQNDRVKQLLAARGGKMPEPLTPPVVNSANTAPVAQTFVVGSQTVELSAREMAMCATKKIDPAKYAATRAGIRARSNVGA